MQIHERLYITTLYPESGNSHTLIIILKRTALTNDSLIYYNVQVRNDREMACSSRTTCR